MPDLAPLRRHERALAALEATLSRELQRVYERLRVALQDALGAQGVTGVRAALPAALRAAQTAAQAATRAAGQRAIVQGEQFAGDELARLGQLLGEPIAAAPAIAATAAARAQLLDVVVVESTQWLSTAGGLILAEATRLEVAGAAPELVAARLLAPGLPTSGPASVWRQGRARIDLAAVSAIFSVDSGGRGAIYRAASPRGGNAYQKQAFAAIDRRTTQCCLRVHGQIQPLDQPFRMAGAPAFGPELMSPPFHHRCRTVISLYHPAMERVGPSTESLRASARREEASR